MEANKLERQNYSILFVDDEEKSLKYFERAYRQHFRILTASDVETAIKLLNHPGSRIAVLITDKRMPNQSGLELLRWSKEHKPHVTRLLTTAYTELEDTIEAINDGEIYRYIPKPWQLEKLREDLDSAMSRFLRLHQQDGNSEEQRVSHEQAYKNASNLAGHIAHELRTPLLNIHAIAKAVETYLPRLTTIYQQHQTDPDLKISERRLKALSAAPETILNNLQQANVLIDNLLANISREHIRTDDFCDFSAAECIKSATEEFPASKNLKECFHFDIKTDFTIHGSEHLLKHVIYNLLSNSLHAITHVGKGEIEIILEKGLEHNYIYFRDTGPGIPEDIIPFIFDEYFSTKPSGKGTGLGLPFCKRVMKAIGGDIYCFSQIGAYTEFMLRFPAAGGNSEINNGENGDHAAPSNQDTLH